MLPRCWLLRRSEQLEHTNVTAFSFAPVLSFSIYPGVRLRSHTLVHSVPWEKESDKANQIYESACHEGNYGMIGMLANTRAAEKLFRQGKGPDPRTMDISTGGDIGGGIERER